MSWNHFVIFIFTFFIRQGLFFSELSPSGGLFWERKWSYLFLKEARCCKFFFDFFVCSRRSGAHFLRQFVITKLTQSLWKCDNYYFVLKCFTKIFDCTFKTLFFTLRIVGYPSTKVFFSLVEKLHNQFYTTFEQSCPFFYFNFQEVQGTPYCSKPSFFL